MSKLQNPEPTSVFVSIGSQYRPEQVRFLNSLVEVLIEFEVRPRVINKTDYPVSQPLRFISDLLGECRGAIIVAFERSHFPTGTEKPGSDLKIDLSDTKVTTPWNQIEAALAYQRGIPLLVLAEKGLRMEGLIEGGHDWYVERVKIDETSLTDRDLRARLQSWCRKVKAGPAETSPTRARNLDESLTLGELTSQISVKTAAQIVGLASSLFLVGVAAGTFMAKAGLTPHP